ncbi:MAG: hypothetical protein ACUVTD_09405, partial [Nitrososphaerales archaeon]
MIKDDIIWISKLLCWIALVIATNYFKVTFLLTMPLLIAILTAEALIRWRMKKEYKMRIIGDLRKLSVEFAKFTYGSYNISLPSIVRELFSDRSFIDATKSMEKLVKVWEYYLKEKSDSLSEESRALEGLLSGCNLIKNLGCGLKVTYPSPPLRLLG